MDELFTQIANLGFPIVVTIFLLVRIESKLNQLSECIHELTAAIKSMQWYYAKKRGRSKMQFRFQFKVIFLYQGSYNLINELYSN